METSELGWDGVSEFKEGSPEFKPSTKPLVQAPRMPMSPV